MKRGIYVSQNGTIVFVGAVTLVVISTIIQGRANRAVVAPR